MIRTALVMLLSVATGVSAQTAADGWSGRIECVLATRGIGYQDDQTHTWVLSGAPSARNDFRDYTAAWSVSGRGTRVPISARAASAGAGDSWTHSGSNPGASITVFVPVGTTTIRISGGQRAVKAAAGLRGTGAAGAFSADLDEWRFQYIDIANGAAQTTLSGSRTQTRSDLVGWRPPPGSTVTETCSWNLAKSGSTSASAGDAKGAAAGTAAGAAGGGARDAAATGAGVSPSAAGAAAGAAAAGGAGAGASRDAGTRGTAAAGAGAGASAKPTAEGGGATAAGGAAAAGATTSGATTGGAAAGAAAGGGSGAGGSRGGTTTGATTTSNPDIVRQYTVLGRTPTPGTGVVFATLFDASGAPLAGVPVADIHLVNAASQPIALGPYVFGAAGDIVEASALGVTFAFNGSSRVAFLDVPVGTFTLTVNVFVAGSVQTLSVQGTSAAGTVTSVQLGSTAARSTGTTAKPAEPTRRVTTASSPDVNRQYAVIGRTPTSGTGLVFATLVDGAGAPLVGVPLANIHLMDATSRPVGLGPYVLGAVGDIVDTSVLSVTTLVDGRSRVAFLDVPVGRLTLTVSFPSGGTTVTRSAQVVTTAGEITLAQP